VGITRKLILLKLKVANSDADFVTYHAAFLNGCRVFVEGGNSGEALLRIRVVVTVYPLHTPVFPSLPLLRADLCHQTARGLYWLASIFATTHFWPNSLTPFSPRRKKKQWKKTQKR
jgi:hypothetical protein